MKTAREIAIDVVEKSEFTADFCPELKEHYIQFATEAALAAQIVTLEWIDSESGWRGNYRYNDVLPFFCQVTAAIKRLKKLQTEKK